MQDAIILFLVIGVIVAIVIVFVYASVCWLNKRFGLDANGKPLKQQIQYIERESKPQVIKIELMQNGMPMSNVSQVNDNFISSMKQTEIRMVDLASDMKNKKVETSFDNGKRIGKVN